MPPKRKPSGTNKLIVPKKLNRGLMGLRKNQVEKLSIDTLTSLSTYPAHHVSTLKPEDPQPEVIQDINQSESEYAENLSYEYLQLNEDTSWTLIE
mgnify:CR=1 FL=1|tara:strand:+ start:1623 stop:1907 length:285 start_codon:yes stop_codon:yes gene_type:complete